MSASNDTTPTTASRFLALPAEIRNKIYEYAFAPTTEAPLQVSLRPSRRRTRDDQLSLLRVNRQVHREAAHIAYDGLVANMINPSIMCLKANQVARDIKAEEQKRANATNASPNDQTLAPQPILAGLTLQLVKKITTDLANFMVLASLCRKCDLGRAFILGSALNPARIRNAENISYLAKRLTQVTHIEVHDEFWSLICFNLTSSPPWIAQILNHKGDVERLLAMFPLLEAIRVKSTTIGIERAVTKDVLLGFAAGARECRRTTASS